MRIAQQLKRTRILLGLTQAEMIDNIMTTSFYSKVEHEKHDITINDLLDILNDHHMSLYDFFSGITELRTEDQIIQDQLTLAFYEEKVDELKALKPKNLPYQETIEAAYSEKDAASLIAILNDPNFTNQKYRQVILLLLTDLGDTQYRISKYDLRKPKHTIFQLGKWDQDSLWIFFMSMSLYSFQELAELINSIFNDYNYQKERDEYSLSLLANIEARYARFCYQDNQRDEFEKALNYLTRLSDSKLILLQKLTVKYYQA